MKPLITQLLCVVMAGCVLATSLLDARADLTTNLAPVADTALFEQNPDNNLGGMSYVIAGTIALGKRSRALIKFDVGAALPANATVTSAALSLVVPTARGAGQGFKLHRVLKDWAEGAGAGGGAGTATQGAAANSGETTWNARFFPATLWDTPGGLTNSDYATAVSATTTMGVSSMTFSSAGMAADVQLWLASGATNFGWIVLVADESITSTASHIASSEDAGNAPVLTVQYTVPSALVRPTLTVLAPTNGNFCFSFNAESNRGYVVEYIGALPGSNWNTLVAIDPSPVSSSVVVTDPFTSSNRLYRVRLP